MMMMIMMLLMIGKLIECIKRYCCFSLLSFSFPAVNAIYFHVIDLMDNNNNNTVVQFYFWCCSYMYYKSFTGDREPAVEIVL